MFCPKCGSIMLPKEEKGQKVISCSCGHKGSPTDIKLTETVKEKDEKIAIAEDKEVLPIVDAECSKCKHTKAYHWEIQTRRADEPPTRFYRCEKCKHTWREYK